MLIQSDNTSIAFVVAIINPYFNLLIRTSTNEHSVSINIFELKLVLAGDLFIDTQYAGD